MKTAINLFLLALLIISTNSCSKQDDCDNPVDCLPPATQTGAGTFGCLINNKVFVPGGTQLGGPTLDANFQFYQGFLYFDLSAVNNKNSPLISVGIFIVGEELIKEKTYTLTQDKESSESQFARVRQDGRRYETTNFSTGEVTITKFNTIEGIVSGTFWFDALNGEGETVEVRQGRFDMKL